MTIASGLERELIDAVRRQAAAEDQENAKTTGRPRSSLGERVRSRARRPYRSAPRRRPLLTAIAICGMLVLCAGIALAASGLLGGAPVRLEGGVPLSPRSDYGVPRAHGVHLLPLSTPDPVGGPPWGARYVLTTRDVGCLQIGRLVRGKLGVIGKDGAFSDDGLFHPLPSDYLRGFYPCATVDADGHAFAAVALDGLPASALLSSGARNGGCVPPGQRQATPACAAADERFVMAGLAGPQAERVFYRHEGRLESVPAVAPYGAYLIVTRMPPSVRATGSFQSYTDGEVGGGPIVKIAYRGGRVIDCAPSRAGQQRTCPAVGEARSPLAPLNGNAVKAPISVTVHKAGSERTLLISFKVPVAVHSARSGYSISVHVPGLTVPGPHSTGKPHSSGECGYTVAGPVSRDVRAGEEIHDPVRVKDICHGRFEITVTFARSSQSDMFPSPVPGRGAQTLQVGRRSVSVP